MNSFRREKVGDFFLGLGGLVTILSFVSFLLYVACNIFEFSLPPLLWIVFGGFGLGIFALTGVIGLVLLAIGHFLSGHD